MNHLPFTVIAYLLNSVSVLIDKFLITDKVQSPLVYIFYFSIFSLFAVLVLPFTYPPSLWIFIVASSTTLLWLGGVYFMLYALKFGQASRVIPIIGSLVPIFLFIQAFFANSISFTEELAVFLLLFGMGFLIINEMFVKTILKENFIKEISLGVLSALFFALSYLVLRYAYLQSNFLTVFAWSKLIIIPIGIFLLVLPKTRAIIFPSKNEKKFNLFSKIGIIFLIGQASGGVSQLLLTFSISLATPALVNSLQGVQYIFLFVATLFLANKFPNIFNEKYNLLTLALKIIGIVLIATGLYMLAFQS